MKLQNVMDFLSHGVCVDFKEYLCLETPTERATYVPVLVGKSSVKLVYCICLQYHIMCWVTLDRERPVSGLVFAMLCFVIAKVYGA